MDEERSQLATAVQILFEDADVACKRQANAWLTSWRTSATAWATCQEVLKDPTANPALQLLCAQTLHALARRPSRYHKASLEEAVGFILQTFPTLPRRVSEQLCLALAALLIQNHALIPLPNSLMALCNFFEDKPGPALAEVLACLPEQARNQAVGMSPSSRAVVLQALSDLGPTVLHALQRSATEPHPVIWRCLQQWLGLVDICSSPLLNGVMGALGARGQEAEAAAELLIDLLQHSPTIHTTCPFAIAAVSQVMQLKQYMMAALHHADEEMFQHVIRVLVALSSTQYCNSDVVEVLLSAMNDCPSISTTQDTFDAWESIAHRQPSLLDPVMDRLLATLMRRTEYTSEYEQWNDDKRDEFGELRRQQRDLLRVLSGRSGQQSEVQVLGILLRDLQQAASNQAWQTVESYLHALSSLSKTIPASESMYMSQLMGWLDQLPMSAPISGAAVVFVGVIGHWLDQNPHALPIAFRVMGRSLAYSELDPVYPLVTKRNATEHAGCVAFQKLSRICSPRLVNNFMADVLTLRIAIDQGVDTGRVTSLSRDLFLEALGTLVSHMPADNATQFLADFCGPLFMSARSLATPNPSSDAMAALRQLAVLFTHIKALPVEEAGKRPDMDRSPAPPTLQLLENNWSVMEAIFQSRVTDVAVSQELCRLLRGTVAQCAHCGGHLSAAVLQCAWRGLEVSLLPLYLELATAAVLPHQWVEEELTAIHKILMFSAEVLHRSSCCWPTGVTAADFLEELCRFLCSLFAVFPDLFLQRPELLAAANSVLFMGLSDQPRATGHAALTAVAALIKSPIITVFPVGSSLVYHLLAAANGALPSAVMEETAMQLQNLLQQVGDAVFDAWMQEALNNEGFPRKKTTVEHKVKFRAELLRHRMHRQKFKQCVKAFCGGKRKGEGVDSM